MTLQKLGDQVGVRHLNRSLISQMVEDKHDSLGSDSRATAIDRCGDGVELVASSAEDARTMGGAESSRGPGIAAA